MTRREVEWDGEQADHMVALAQYRVLLCGRCGGYLPETTGPKAVNAFYVDDGGGVHVCFRCEAMREAHADHADDPRLPSMIFAVSREEVSDGRPQPHPRPPDGDR